ncbi:MAG: lipopolysaccharide biosynthesis protein [Comamonas sp.]|nr:lipopolysaccharide biosynthesis protein [Comamonas sp.]
METQSPQNEEPDLLDLLVTLAENWKLLILGPLAAGLIASSVGLSIPKTYESSASVRVERPGSSFTAPMAASLAMSADVLHQIAPVAGLDEGLTAEKIYKKLSRRITVSIGRQDKLLNITTQASSPETAQKLNQALLDTIFPLSKPRGLEKQQLGLQLDSEKKRLQESLKLEQDTAAYLASGKGVNEATSRLYGELLTANSNRQKAILDIERQLEGLDGNDIVQMPTLPEQSIKPRISLLATGAAVVTAFVLLIFVFIRKALLATQKLTPEKAEKIARIREAMHW